MSDFTKTTNFTAKDSLPSGNVAKKILGSLFDTEFDNIATAISSKSNTASPTFTGTVTLPTLVTSAGITVGADILSDTDSTDSLGSTGVRWAKVWTDDLTSGTLTATSGSITDSSGAISFGNENLTTTGTLASGALTVTGGVLSTTGGGFATTSGNIGVGVTSGQNLLHVQKASLASAVYRTGADTPLIIESGAGSAYIQLIPAVASATGLLVGNTADSAIAGFTHTAAAGWAMKIAGSTVHTFGAAATSLTGTLTTTGSITGADITADGVINFGTNLSFQGTIDHNAGSGANIYRTEPAGTHVFNGDGTTTTKWLEVGSNLATFASEIRAVAATLTGVITTSDTTDSTSTTTGSIHTDGGLGVAKTAWIGTLKVRNSGNHTIVENTVSNGDLYLQTAGGGTDSTLFYNASGLRARLNSAGLAVEDQAIIGSTSVTPDGTLHVYSGSAGSGTLSTAGDELIIEGAADTGITIFNPNASEGNIIFATPSDIAGALITWAHDASTFSVGSAKVGASTLLKGDNAVTNLTLSGASGSESALFAGIVGIDGGYLTVTDASSVATIQVIAEAGSDSEIEFTNKFSGNKTWGMGLDYSASQDFVIAYAATNGVSLSSGRKFAIDTSGNVDVTGDLTLSEGKVAITDTANETALTVTSSATTANGVDWDFDSLTTGHGLDIRSNSASTSSRAVINVIQEHASASGAVGVSVRQDGADAAIEMNGGGIKFTNATASSDVNTLDDYEEGTFTPTLAFATAGTSFSDVPVGQYTKIGNTVCVMLRIRMTKGTGTGDLTLGGLPFASSSQTNYQCAGTVSTDTWGVAGKVYQVVLLDSSTTPTLLSITQAGGVSVAMDDTDLGASGATIRVQLTYQI